MNRPPPGPEEERRLEREAAAWFVKCDRGLTPAEQDAYFQWLAADPLHGEWLSRHRRTWMEFNLLTHWKPEHSAEPNPDLLARFPRRTKRSAFLPWVIGLAAAACLVVGFTFWSSTPEHLHETKVAAVLVLSSSAGYERRVLEDGSVVELNRGAQVEVSYRPTERRLHLLRGEAVFTVAKNPARPFIVRAGNVDVRAVGTAFNINLEKHQVGVLVTEGRVRVDDALRGDSILSATASGEIPVLSAGQKITVGISPTAPVSVSKLSPLEVTRLLAWRPDLLEFAATPLAEVAEVFNGRNTVQLIIVDEVLRDVPIVASFRADNVEGFVRLLELTAKVRAERNGDEIRLYATH